MKRLIFILSLVLAVPAYAVQPDEMLSDPALEARAREVSKDLRCLVCRNESIDDSNAELARDLRILVRERITAGDSNPEVKQYLVDRYGEYVLLKPLTGGVNWLLWGAGPLMLLIALVIGIGYLRKRQSGTETPVVALSEEEQTRLKEIMGE
ncbi:cytochrome c-type biogenesis protein CcmH [Thalassovita litoralis]|jgi:cytochrome c-type biogenesis protein CcmH|uniref:Cytochrome c-type biogenesis protein n=1 Tax=Thalassovita litoralis TaxID=1010611 RepID=A0A521BUR4_9RHOB|nr:cytochrome c-type biogenesis protein [Thalassovita litoralis]SMO50896.1 cytochrome c-type biogenesis protein CcmH [Thalassovita litoralis]